MFSALDCQKVRSSKSLSQDCTRSVGCVAGPANLLSQKPHMCHVSQYSDQSLPLSSCGLLFSASSLSFSIFFCYMWCSWICLWAYVILSMWKLRPEKADGCPSLLLSILILSSRVCHWTWKRDSGQKIAVILLSSSPQ